MDASLGNNSFRQNKTPFTYIPGGINLAEIKSERMAKRLVRNATDPGVPESPIQNCPTPVLSKIPVPINNFNCLPVRVFPVAPLPSNPKALLKRRSIVDEAAETNSTNDKQKDIIVPSDKIKTDGKFSKVGHNGVLAELNNNNISKIPMDKLNNNQNIIKTSGIGISEAINLDINDKQDKKGEISQNQPSKSSKKVETKVEVVKKQLSNGDVEEIKTTTTTTTIDGKTEIKKDIEKKLFPKKDENGDDSEDCYTDETVEESDEENNNKNGCNERVKDSKIISDAENKTNISNSDNEKVGNHNKINSILKKQEYSDSSTTKKVVVIQDSSQEISDEVDSDSERIEEKQTSNLQNCENSSEDVESQCINESNGNHMHNTTDEILNENENSETQKETNDIKSNLAEKSEDNESQSEAEIEKQSEETKDKETDKTMIEGNDESISTKTIESEGDLTSEQDLKIINISQLENQQNNEISEDSTVSEPKTSNVILIDKQEEKNSLEENTETCIEKSDEIKNQNIVENQSPNHEGLTSSVSEPVVPLEKVEEVVIKPINQNNTSTDSKSILDLKNMNESLGALQTELKRVENIITVKKTTHILSKEFAEDNFPKRLIDVLEENKNNSSLQPTESLPVNNYMPTLQSFSNSPSNLEIGHSSLLNRTSVERQIPISYDYSNHSNLNYTPSEDCSQEPRSEVLNINNVKPSMISNQCWYQQSKKDNIEKDFECRPTIHAQPFSQSQYERTLPQWHPSTTENLNHQNIGTQKHFDYSFNNADSHSFSKPTVSEVENKYQYFPSSHSNVQQKSYYVPPPWEQDSSYSNSFLNLPNFTKLTSAENYGSYNCSSNQFDSLTKTSLEKPKKCTTTSYIPPAPNQSFVKYVDQTVPSTIPGRKTYYSEYERRFISVPESTYVPNNPKADNKLDQRTWSNNQSIYEPPQRETIEQVWKKELRETTEQNYPVSYNTESKNIKPPWENDPNYGQPTTIKWTETLRPRSWREKSVEPEYTTVPESLKTQSLGRNKQYNGNVEKYTPDRSRGVSLDRFGNQGYSSPVPFEHPPVRSQILDPAIAPPLKGHHNLKAPDHNHNSTFETNQQAAIPRTRPTGQPRSNPIQSRSFKYLQWITGTEE